MTNRLVVGVGINDADYTVKIKKTLGKNQKGGRIQEAVWSCPFYERWHSMLKRCYSNKNLTKHPSYKGCTVIPEWHLFSTFKAWMEQQDWEGKQLDKDILFPGNKEYGPITCCFVDARINNFVLDSKSTRGCLPVGVTWIASKRKFRASCNEVYTGRRITIGHFLSPKEAHLEWLKFKLNQCLLLIKTERLQDFISKALIDRYENYKET